MALSTTTRKKLRNEIQIDPEGIGYTGSDQNVLNKLTALTRTRERTSMTGDEIFQQTATDAVLTATKKGHWLSFCARSTIDPFASANVDFVKDLFGTATGTITNLQTSRVQSISRLTELKIGVPTLHQIAVARA